MGRQGWSKPWKYDKILGTISIEEDQKDYLVMSNRFQRIIRRRTIFFQRRGRTGPFKDQWQRKDACQSPTTINFITLQKEKKQLSRIITKSGIKNLKINSLKGLIKC